MFYHTKIKYEIGSEKIWIQCEIFKSRVEIGSWSHEMKLSRIMHYQHSFSLSLSPPLILFSSLVPFSRCVNWSDLSRYLSEISEKFCTVRHVSCRNGDRLYVVENIRWANIHLRRSFFHPPTLREWVCALSSFLDHWVLDKHDRI